MYRVLIAEDELFVRVGIKMSVEWEKLGMEVIADVANGKQALEVYEQEKPDIVLTDIRMPVMDGMELIRTIRERDQETRIIILSCLEEFQLVKEAISMNVSDYILKLTMTREDMEKVLVKARDELAVMRAYSQADAVSPEARRRKLLDFLYYEKHSEAYYKDELENLALPFGERNLMMAVLEVNQYENLQQCFGDEHGMLISFMVCNVLNELLEEYGMGIVLEGTGHRFILIAEHGDQKQKAAAEYSFDLFLGRVRKSLSRYLQIGVAIGVSQLFDGYENLRRMYRQCSYCMEQSFFHDTGENLLYGKLFRENPVGLVEGQLRVVKESGDMDDRDCRLMDGALEAFRENPQPKTLKKYFEYLISLEIESVMPDGRRRFTLVEEKARRVEEAETLSQVLDLYVSCHRQLLEDAGEQKVISHTVAGILRYVSKNYSQNMPLEQIAESVGLSPNYVCGLFKKEMGLNLSDYIMEYRLNRAKELLVSTNLKSYEIAEQTGFSDESYFSRSFKKKTGQSPSEFRRGLYSRKEG